MTEEEISDDTQDKRRRLYNVYRTGLLVFTSLYTFFFAGAFFGYGPMILLLQRDEAFFSKCNNENEEPTCPDQNSQLLNIHFVGTIMQVLTPFVGHLMDTRGPVVTMFYTAATALLGIVMLIVSRVIPLDELLYPAFCLLGMNSCATSVMCVATGPIFSIYAKEQMSPTDTEMMEEAKGSKELEDLDNLKNDSLEVSEVPKKGSDRCQGNEDDSSKSEDQDGSQGKGPRRVIGFLNNLFDAGSITYLLMWEAHKSLEVSLQVLCYWYLAAGVFIFGGALIFWILVLKHQQRDKELKEETDQVSKSSYKSAEDKRSRVLEMKQEEAPPRNNQDDYSASICTTAELAAREVTEGENKEEWRELFSAPFLWLVAFFAFHICRNIFVLTSAEAFLEDLGDTGDKYISIFTMMMPASVLGFPFVDWALGNFGYHKALQLINLLGLLHGIIQISATSSLDVQIIGFLVFSFYRCFLFSVIFAYLSVLMPKKVLGKANGFLHIFAGVAGWLNIPLGNAAVQQWNGSFFIPNCIYTIGILPFFYAAYGTTAGIRSKENQEGGSEEGAYSGFLQRKSSLPARNLQPPPSSTDDEVAKA